VFLLAYRHLNDPEEAIIVSTNLGGDTVNRGAILGAILGAVNKKSAFPARWFDQLHDKNAVAAQINKFVAAVSKL